MERDHPADHRAEVVPADGRTNDTECDYWCHALDLVADTLGSLNSEEFDARRDKAIATIRNAAYRLRAGDGRANLFDAETALRQEWWAGHGCPVAALYGDDGEMQCNAATCMRDFKREPLDVLAQHVHARRLARLVIAEAGDGRAARLQADTRGVLDGYNALKPSEKMEAGQRLALTVELLRQWMELALTLAGQPEGK